MNNNNNILYRIPVIHLHGRAIWYLADFMREHIPYIGRTLDPPIKKINENRRLFVKKLDDEFNILVNKLYVKMCEWLIKWDAENNAKIKDIKSSLHKETKLLSDGLVLCWNIQNLLSQSLWLHLDLGYSFKPNNIRSLSILAELLKTIEDAFHRRSKRLSSDISYMATVISFDIQKILLPYQERIDRQPRPSSAELDCLAALNLCHELLSTAPTKSRLVVINCAMMVASMTNMMKNDIRFEIKYKLYQLNLVSSYQNKLNIYTDCSMLYWGLDLVPLILNDIYKNPNQSLRLPVVFAYLNDPVIMLKNNKHELNINRIFEYYKEDIQEYMYNEILKPLSSHIETDLRLQVMDMMNEKFKRRSRGFTFGLSSASISATMTSIDQKQLIEIAKSGQLDQPIKVGDNKSMINGNSNKKKLSKKELKKTSIK